MAECAHHIYKIRPFPFTFVALKMAGSRPAPVLRTRNRSRITAPQLEQFVVVDVQLTGVSLGAGAYGSVEEVEIPGARVAAKKLHTQLVNLGSPQQVSIILLPLYLNTTWCNFCTLSISNVQA